MKCFFCKKNVDQENLSNVVPLKHEDETVYGCTKHRGVLEEYSRQFNDAVKNPELKSILKE